MPSWLNLQAYAFDRPVQYKKLQVFPVTMENFYEFQGYVQCLLLEKNTNLEGISKTYLEYLYGITEQEDKDNNLLYFDALLKLCLRKKDLEIRYGRNKDTKKPVFIIYGSREKAIKNEGGEIYDSSDFDELRKLICEQNDVEIPDETISKEVRDSMDEVLRFKLKQSGAIPPTLEDQVVCVMVSTGLSLDNISKISIRKFGQLLQRVDMKLNYQIYMTAAMSGMVEFKDKSILKHWMSGVKVDKFKDTMIDIDTLKDKLGGSAQENKK